MIPYILLILFSFLFSFIAVKKKGRNKYSLYIGTSDYVKEHNMALPVFFLGLFLLISLRGLSIGNDTHNYSNMFVSYRIQKVSSLMKLEMEELYILLNWFIGQFTDNFQWLLIITSVIIVIPIYVLYNQDKQHSYLKVILFVNMSVFVMLFSGIRQAIAMSIGIIAFYFVKKKKLFLFLLTVIIAIGFHQSAFMLFVMYPLYYFRMKKNHIYIIGLLIAIVYVYNESIFAGLLNIMSLLGTRFDDYTAIENSGAVTMIICFVLFTVFSYIVPDDEKVDTEFVGMRNYLALATLLQCFAPLHNLAMRMNYYFILFIPVVMAQTVNYADVRWKQIARVAEIVICVFFTVYFIFTVYTGSQTDGGALNTFPYVPFWV